MLVQKATLAPARTGILETDTSILISGTMNAPMSTRVLLPKKEDTARIAPPMQPFYQPNMHVVVPKVSHQDQLSSRTGVVPGVVAGLTSVPPRTRWGNQCTIVILTMAFALTFSTVLHAAVQTASLATVGLAQQHQYHHRLQL